MLYREIRYINDGEPLDQVTLNRYTYDIQENLEELFDRTGGSSSIGEVENIPDTIALRDNYGTTKFSTPREGTNPLRVNDIVNRLDSNEVDRPLSAAMGSALVTRLKEAIPVGVIVSYGSSISPNEWLICDGSYLSRSSYSRLFNVIGITFGNTNSSNFRLPDLRGEFIRGLDSGRGADPDSGRNLGSFQNEEFKEHRHTLKGNDREDIAGQSLAAGLYSDDAENTTTDPNSISQAGGDETRPRNVALNFIIKY